MQIVLIGAGRLATNLGLTLLGAGHEIICVNSRTMTSAKALADRIGGVPVDRAEDMPMEADAYIISVKDSVLADVIPAVTKGRESQVFMHTAGSMPMEMFRGMAHHYGVFYPMQSFSKERPVDFAEIPTFIEASDEKAMQVIRHLAESVTERVYELSSDDRQYLHLAAVFACNFVNHCYAMAAEVLEEYKGSIQFDHIDVDKTVAKVSIVGAGMIDDAGVAAKMFGALYDADINIHMISTSEIKVSVLLDENDSNAAVQAIHDKFFGE